MAIPESDTLTSTIEKFLKADKDLSQAKSLASVEAEAEAEAEAKFVQALESVASISLDQSQYEWVQIGYILQGLSEFGYATEVNQLIQKWEIQCAEAPPESLVMPLFLLMFLYRRKSEAKETGNADSSV